MMDPFIRLILLSLLASWLVSLGQVSGEAAYSYDNHDDSSPRLPPIWVDNQFGIDGGFRILSEVHFPQSEASFMFEEWSLGSGQHYRLDIIHTDTSKRRTILANGRLEKKFHFEPYICSMIDGLGAAMGPKFTEKFPQGHKFVVAGLGSIYLEAMRSSHDANARVSFTRASTREDGHNFRDYDQFIVRPANGSSFKFEIHLYFYESFQLGQTKPGSLVALHLIDPNSKTSSSDSDNVVLKARIIEIETGTEAISKMTRQAEDLFELPLGYGCTEPEAQGTAKNHYNPPENCFSDSNAHDPAPRELQIEVSALLPSSLDHDVDKWRFHSSNLRLLSGQLEGRQYLVVEKHEQDPGESAAMGQQAKIIHSLKSKPSTRRTRRVWDLGDSATTTTVESDKPPATYFDIDTNSGRCMNFSEGRLDKLAGIEFPLLDSSGTSDKLIQAGLTFDDRTLRKLFLDTYGYYPVRETRQDWLKFNEIVEERRDHLFELHNRQGDWAWQGPVSIVRKSNEFDLSYKSDQRYSANDKKVRLILLFYTKKLDQLIGKIYIDLAPCRLVGAREFHQSISILPCLRPPPGSGATNLLLGSAGQRFEPKAATAVGFRINYPIEQLDNHLIDTQGLLLNNGQVKEAIYREFLASFVRLTTRQVDLLQLSPVTVDMTNAGQSVLISGKLYEWPTIFEFHRFYERRMQDEALSEDRLVRELKPSEAKCADSCVHLNCLMFDYCHGTNECNLLIQNQAFDSSRTTTTTTVTRSKELAIVRGENCSLFMRRRDKHQSISPMEFVHRFQSQLLLATDSGSEGNSTSEQSINLQLALGLENSTNIQILELVPSVMEVLANCNDGDGDEFGLLNHSKQPAREFTRLKVGADPIKAEYQMLFAGKKFATTGSSRRPQSTSDQFPLHEANYMDYEDCESLCEENDCRSFSHCQIEKTCLISRLHKSGEIAQHLESVQSCRVLVRNYLSKFHKFQDKQLAITKPRGFMKQLEAHSDHDCATNCMDETQFKCRSFIFCKNMSPATDGGGGGGGCYLRKSRGSKLMASSDEPSDNGTNNECDLFVRSYLSEFDPYYGKRLNLLDDQLVSQKGLGAELCAAQCAEMMRDGQQPCRAFQVCLAKNQPVCAIPQDDSYHTNMMSNMTIGYSQLESESKCTTFVLSTKSELYQEGLTSLVPDAAIPELDPDDSRWFIRMILLMIGVFMGYSLAWLIDLIICHRR